MIAARAGTTSLAACLCSSPLLVVGCYESHAPVPVVIPEDARLIEARIEGDYVINAWSERLSTIQSVPRLIVTDYNSLVVASETSVATYVLEERGSRFWRWS